MSITYIIIIIMIKYSIIKGPVGGIIDPHILLLSILLLTLKFRTAKTASLYVLPEAR